MPLIKSTTTPQGVPVSFHIVDYVEIFRLGDRLGWRGRYRSYANAEAYRVQGGPPLATGTFVGVPYQQADDPVAAFEEAVSAFSGSEMYGATVVAALEQASPLEVLKMDQWEQVKFSRDAYLASGVTTPYGVFDSDLTSIVNMIGAATMAATAGDDWSDQWILKDRTVVTLSRAQLVEVGALLADFRGRTYRRGDELYRAIQEAETVEQVRAVTWSPGVA